MACLQLLPAALHSPACRSQRSLVASVCQWSPTPPAAEELDEDERRPRRRRRLEEAQAGMDEDEDLVSAAALMIDW